MRRTVPHRRRLLAAGSALALVCTLASTVTSVAASPKTATAATPAASSTPIYLNTSYPFEARAADLVSRMTLARRRRS